MGSPITWEAKDADETIPVSLNWAADIATNGALASSIWIDATGGLSTSDEEFSGAETRAFVAGGVNGTPGSVTNRVTFADSPTTLEQVVIVPVRLSSEGATGATPEALKAKYPAFAAVSSATIQLYLDDTVSSVDSSWFAVDQVPAKLAKAAHEMALAGIGERSEVDSYAAAGINRIGSGQVNISLSEAKVARSSGGTLNATVYGQAYKRLLRRNKAGPRLAGGAACVDGWGPTAQLNNGGVLPWAS